MNNERYSWWSELKHGGLLIAPTKLGTYFPETIEPLPAWKAERLRRQILGNRELKKSNLGSLLDVVLEEILALDKELWLKGSGVDSSWSRRLITRENYKPQRVWQTENGFSLPIFVADVSRDGARLGIGRGRRTVAKTIEWLRLANQKIALLTNGREWRLIHAGADYDAWTEWDTELWFEEGKPSRQVDALRILLGKDSLTADKPDDKPPLLQAIEDSRQSQAEISAELGERVRQAVEILIRESVSADRELTARNELRVNERDIYVAATRLVMRLVVILFAEARDLLPRSQPFYHDSYGLQGLREQLERLSGGRTAALKQRQSAWLRILALFRTIHEGSPIPDLLVPRYGGKLFVSGKTDANDPVRRALTLFEQSSSAPNDAAIYSILKLLTRSRIKVRQGRGSRWVEAPVDFSDFSSEYIGILYEGLLDYELRQADQDNPIVFLNVGDEPALPLLRLENMSDRDLSNLLEKFKQTNESGDEEESQEEEPVEEAETPLFDSEEEIEEEVSEAIEEEILEDEALDDRTFEFRNRVQAWATRAVKAGNLVRRPRGSGADAQAEYERKVNSAAKNLVSRLVLPGEWYLVRWGGTRKGSGTFYTRPQLAVPTMRRTLEPLIYKKNEDTGELEPRLPEEILSLKVCDPAMGSGSFLVGALRYLADALYASLLFHGRIDNSKTLPQMLGLTAEARLGDERLPIEPEHEDFEDRLKARLKRYVVERCLYGVDFNELAVELGRLALWIETMDKDLPFEFLDHKLKRGNALVGCWFDRFRDYPVMAWMREGGDKNHTNFVHHFREKETKKGVNLVGDVWTQSIKDFLSDTIKPQMPAFINSRRTDTFDFQREGYSPEGLHDEALQLFEKLHELPIDNKNDREATYRREFTNNPQLKKLKSAFDAWCAVWFWRGDKLDSAITPNNFYDLGEETKHEIERLAEEIGFFHWEIEFPDVFAAQNGGFDAIIGNPPWEIQKPNSKEFFSNIDPLYRTYGKQDAIKKQKEYFENEVATETSWLDYNSKLKSLSNWVKYVGTPFGDPQDDKDSTLNFTRSGKENGFLHSNWRFERKKHQSYADGLHPFRFQGSADINTYKMFLETAHNLLKAGGRLGFIVPSGVYTDKGSTDLRNLFLNRANWEWLFGIINWNKIFAGIYYRFKFCIAIVEKGSQTQNIKSAFTRYHIEEWENAEQLVLNYPRKQIEEFSPKSKSILELRSGSDLRILQKIYSNSVLLGNQGTDAWGIKYRTEFHMTNDSKLFPPVEKWIENGFMPDEYGHWLKGNWQAYVDETSILNRENDLILTSDKTASIKTKDIEAVSLPLYEGRMIGQFDFSQKGWVSGKGRTAVWREIPCESKTIEPQYLMSSEIAFDEHNVKGLKISIMGIASSTNARSANAALSKDFPCNHALNLIRARTDQMTLNFTGVVNSLVFDYAVRCRLGGLNLSFFVLDETPAPLPSKLHSSFSLLVAKLNCIHPLFSNEWLDLILTPDLEKRRWKSLWAVTDNERLRLRCIIDAVMAELYGLDVNDFAWILKDCDYSIEQIRSSDVMRTLDPKGFWRVDKDLEPELRHTILSLVAFHELKRIGLDAFLNLNDGEGWMLPETLRLADYDLGHDDRAKQHQPVASRLGERFMNWQLKGTPEESWEECCRHAENIARIRGEYVETVEEDENQTSDKPKNLFGEELPTNLFGDIIYPKNKRG